MELYISCGVPLNLQDYDGRTPLHIAASNGYKTLFNLLVKSGADAQIKDNFGNISILADKEEVAFESPKK